MVEKPAKHRDTTQLPDMNISGNLLDIGRYPRNDWSQAQPILLTTIKRALDKSGIEIPFPQRVVWDGKD